LNGKTARRLYTEALEVIPDSAERHEEHGHVLLAVDQLQKHVLDGSHHHRTDEILRSRLEGAVTHFGGDV
jgi:hypothetical protein